jgi:hypothetical protein
MTVFVGSGHLGPAPSTSVYDGHVVALMMRELVDYTGDEVVDVCSGSTDQLVAARVRSP